MPAALDAIRQFLAEPSARLPCLEVADSAPDRVAGSAGERPGGLTRREAEVLQLVARGKSNREIAGLLVLSERTVERHISNIYLKINVGSRAQATVYAMTNHLLESWPPGPTT